MTEGLFSSSDLQALEIGKPFPASQWDVARAILSQRSTGPYEAGSPIGSSVREHDVDTDIRWGILDETLAAGGTADVSLWRKENGDWGGWDEDSEIDWECYAPPVMTSGTIAAGKWVGVGIVNGRKVVLWAEC